MTEPYFNYSFNNTYSNYVYTEPMFNNDLPITNNLVKRLKASNYNTVNKSWPDSGILGNNVLSSNVFGSPTVDSYTANTNNTNGAINAFNIIRLNTTSGFSELNKIEPDFTLFNICRYSGNTKGRILQGTTDNCLYGFHGETSGVAHYNNWVTQSSNSVFGSNWVISTSYKTAYRGNGTDLTTNTNSVISYLPKLAINAGAFPSQPSDCEIAEIIIYNKRLSTIQIGQIENYLSGLYGIYGSNLVAVTTNNPTFSTTDKIFGTKSLMLVATSSQYLTLPSFTIESGTGLSFSVWFKSNNTATWGRIIDFGIGTENNNIIIFINSGNLGISARNSGGTCQLYNLLSNCNDNTWRHFVWTISPNGSIWSIYVNGNKIIDLTASNFSTYSSGGVVGPLYPTVVSRTSNFIGKSNWSGDAYFNGAIDEFKMFMNTLTSNDVASLYSSNVTYTPPGIENKSTYTKLNISLTPVVGSIIMYAGQIGNFIQGTNGLKYDIYTSYHNENPDFVSTVTNSGIITNLTNISTGTNGYFATDVAEDVTTTVVYTVVWTGYFKSDFTGAWTFNLRTDDGGYLWLGPNAIKNYTISNSLINNGGAHAMITVTSIISLESGKYYPIRILAGNGGGPGGCNFSWSRNSSDNLSNGVGYFYQGTTTTTNPDGWLYCDGFAYNRTTYSNLFNVIGTAYGSGDGSTTFNVPDLTGKYVRGTVRNTNNSVDTGGNSNITLTSNNVPSHYHTGTTSETDPVHSHVINIKNGSLNDLHNVPFYEGQHFGNWGNATHPAFDMSESGSHTHTYTTESVGSSYPISLIPKSMFTNFLIKY